MLNAIGGTVLGNSSALLSSFSEVLTFFFFLSEVHNSFVLGVKEC